MFNMRRMKALGIGYFAQKLTLDFFSQLDLRREVSYDCLNPIFAYCAEAERLVGSGTVAGPHYNVRFQQKIP